MTDPTSHTITELLQRASTDAGALDELLPLVYDHLRGIASSQLRLERDDHTLQATALVHEAYLKLAQSNSLSVADRGHFFRVAARAMRQILVDHARARHRAKRGGSGERVVLEPEHAVAPSPEEDVLAVDAALGRLAVLEPRQANVIELRYFAGLSIEQTAESLGVSIATVKRDWQVARAWLQRDLES